MEVPNRKETDVKTRTIEPNLEFKGVESVYVINKRKINKIHRVSTLKYSSVKPKVYERVKKGKIY